jgi:CHAT domain-containing protein
MTLKKCLVWIISLCCLMASFSQAVTSEEQLELAANYHVQVEQYYQQGQFDKALPLAKEALQIREELLGEQHPDTLKSLSKLAAVYKSMGHLKKALPLFEKSYRLSEKVLGEQHPDTLENLKNVVALYPSKGVSSQALPLSNSGILSQALSLSETSYHLRKQVLIEKQDKTLINLHNLADAYTAPGQIDKAIQYFEQLIKNVETLRHSGDLSAENRRSLLKKWISGYFKLSQLYLRTKRFNEAFQMAEKTKARTLLDSMVMKLAIQKTGLNISEQQQLQNGQNRIAFLNQKIATEVETDKRLVLEMEKKQLVRQIAEFHRTLMQKYPKYAQLNDFQIITARSGASLIPQNALFISYLVQGNRVLVFTLDSTGHLQVKDLGEIPNFEQTLKRYHYWLSKCKPRNFKCDGKRVWKVAKHHFKNADKVRDGEIWRDEKTNHGWKVWKIDESDIFLLIGQKPPRDKKPRRIRATEFRHYFDQSHKLAQQLLEPFQARLQSKRRLIISPDGALALIPFETLILDDKPLIVTHQVSYVQSLYILPLLKEREKEYKNIKNRGTLLAMGAARYSPEKISSKCNQPNQEVFRQKMDITWCNLPHSETELDKLAELFKDNQPLIYKHAQASEAQLKKLNEDKILTRYQYLVFSAHAYFDEKIPYLSAIILDQVNLTEDTDGFITASEWAGYDLRSDLLVLSACQTGRGKIVRGEGVMGLPYAFYVAGSKNTLMTLWTLLDETTAEFTVLFFKKLKMGQSQIEALTETKREFINSGKYQHPWYWGAFVLYGI